MRPFPRMKFERLRRNMSQTAVGKLVGLTQTEVSQIERRRMAPTTNTLQELARLLDVPADVLLDDVQPAERPAATEEGR